MARVVTAFLRNRGELLHVRRSDTVATYPGHWGGISGYVEDDPEDPFSDALREIREEVGIDSDQLTLVRGGDPVEVADAEGSFTVHPFLFDSATRTVILNEELTDSEWAPATAMLNRRTVPKLWTAYRRVAPTIESIRRDDTHGAAYLSVRALEVLRDEAAVATDWSRLARLARDLRAARPDMAVLRTRLDGVMFRADRSPSAVLDEANAAITTAADADAAAADAASEFLADVDGSVVTLSRSGTVRAVLPELHEPVLVAESRPGEEGREVARELAAAGHDVTLFPDSAAAAVLNCRSVGAVLAGADTILPDGSVINKTGTRGLALAAAREGIPCCIVAAAAKIAPSGTSSGSDIAPDASGFEPPEDVTGIAPLFDRTPSDLVTVITERGTLDATDVDRIAAEHAEFTTWVETVPD